MRAGPDVYWADLDRRERYEETGRGRAQDAMGFHARYKVPVPGMQDKLMAHRYGYSAAQGSVGLSTPLFCSLFLLHFVVAFAQSLPVLLARSWLR